MFCSDRIACRRLVEAGQSQQSMCDLVAGGKRRWGKENGGEIARPEKNLECVLIVRAHQQQQPLQGENEPVVQRACVPCYN